MGKKEAVKGKERINTKKAFILLWRYLVLQKWKILWGVLATFSIGIMELLTGAFLKFLTNTVTKIQGLAEGGAELKIPVKLNLDLKLIGEKIELINTNLKGSEEIMKGIVIISAVFFVLYLFQGIFQYLREVFMNLAIERVLQKFKSDIFRAVLKAPLKNLEENNTGQVISRVNYDVAVLTETINILIEISRFVIYMLMFVPAMFLINTRFALYTIIFFPVSFIIIRFVASIIKRSSKDVSDNVGDYTSFLDERINKLRFIKAFRTEEKEQETFDKLVETNYHYRKKLILQRFFLKPSNEVIGMLVLAFLFILFSRNLLSGNGNIGDIAFFLYLVKTSFKPVKKVARAVGDLNMALISTAKIERVFEMESERSSYSNVIPDSGIETLKLVDMDFSYDKDRKVFARASLEIKRGEKIHLSGETGAGKTSLSYLLTLFIEPDGGSFLINGLKADSYAPQDVRKHIHYVSGETPLIPGTIKENLLYGTGADLSDARQYSDLLPSVVFSEPGLVVEGPGTVLTSGEARKIALVRALLSGSSTIILDEVFVNMDDKDIELFLKTIPSHTTCITISRNPLVSKLADRTITLDKGQFS